MKLAYFDCFSGISGDMILGSFLDCGLPLDTLKKEIDKLHLEGIKLDAHKVDKKGIAATMFDVIIPHEHVHRGLKEIKEIINQSSLSDFVKSKSIVIFTHLAQAEGKIHDKPPDEIHFHEVGALDAIVDIVGAVICLEFFHIGKVYSSKIKLGSGSVNCAHGILPVPVPAVLELLAGTPVSPSGIEAEIVTPTGAAIISTLSSGYGVIPQMKLDKTGYGAGSKDLPHPNILRVIIGESDQKNDLIHEEICLIETNIDDMNPQFYEYVIDSLFHAGALDVFLTPVIMKKGRPGIVLSVLCEEIKLRLLVDIIVSETSTIGIRFKKIDRLKAARRIEKVHTKYGEVSIKIAEVDGEIVSKAPEYKDCIKLAFENHVPLKDLYLEINRTINK
ncbi:nickel pincer cofactor biosynthesis protein LarC [bacterium]|nr:nickel pincer cofactor biosynthesis protein LarC [bacterium]